MKKKKEIRKKYEPQNKKDDYKDTSVYHGVSGCYEPILVMEHLVREYIKRGISADCAMNLALAVKYLMRIGTKDDVQKEMFKAENYVHRGRTAGWMNPEVSQETK